MKNGPAIQRQNSLDVLGLGSSQHIDVPVPEILRTYSSTHDIMPNHDVGVMPRQVSVAMTEMEQVELNSRDENFDSRGGEEL